MIKSACSAMKKSIIISATLLITGVFLEVIAQFLSLETMVPVLFTYGGFFAIALGITIFLATMIVIMVPKVNQQLDTCQH